MKTIYILNKNKSVEIIKQVNFYPLIRREPYFILAIYDDLMGWLPSPNAYKLNDFEALIYRKDSLWQNSLDVFEVIKGNINNGGTRLIAPDGVIDDPSVYDVNFEVNFNYISGSDSIVIELVDNGGGDYILLYDWILVKDNGDIIKGGENWEFELGMGMQKDVLLPLGGQNGKLLFMIQNEDNEGMSCFKVENVKATKNMGNTVPAHTLRMDKPVDFFGKINWNKIAEVMKWNDISFPIDWVSEYQFPR